MQSRLSIWHSEGLSTNVHPAFTRSSRNSTTVSSSGLSPRKDRGDWGFPRITAAPVENDVSWKTPSEFLTTSPCRCMIETSGSCSLRIVSGMVPSACSARSLPIPHTDNLSNKLHWQTSQTKKPVIPRPRPKATVHKCHYVIATPLHSNRPQDKRPRHKSVVDRVSSISRILSATESSHTCRWETFRSTDKLNLNDPDCQTRPHAITKRKWTGQATDEMN